MRRAASIIARFAPTICFVPVLAAVTVGCVVLPIIHPTFVRHAHAAQRFEPASAPASQPSSRPTSRPATNPLVRRVDALVSQLGDKDYQRRESAQQELQSLGSAIAPLLIKRIPHPDPETSDRLIALIGAPGALSVRIDFAVRLLETTDLDHIERAVYLLFDDPSAVCEPFKTQVRDATGAMRVICAPIIDQLEQRRAGAAISREQAERIRKKSPSKAEELMQMDKGTNLYAAEAAYWSAVEALADYAETTPRPADEKANRPASRGPIP